LVNEKYEIISMIKPQFEASKELVGRGGIVKDEKVHNNICREIKLWLTKNFQYKIIKIIESPILGQKGNKEFLIYLRN
jgi:23S rRNA (cytidine1920-2'-O)/16S rRNA (cytidine1409-2'-O)-methyltransferase